MSEQQAKPAGPTAESERGNGRLLLIMALIIVLAVAIEVLLRGAMLGFVVSFLWSVVVLVIVFWRLGKRSRPDQSLELTVTLTPAGICQFQDQWEEFISWQGVAGLELQKEHLCFWGNAEQSSAVVPFQAFESDEEVLDFARTASKYWKAAHGVPSDDA